MVESFLDSVMNNINIDKDQALIYTSQDRVIRDYVSRGLIVLSPDSLGISKSIHSTIFTKEKAALEARQRIDAVRVPEILDVLNAPGVVRACDQLLGSNWAIVPFTHNTPFMSGSHDQHWHKDDNGPYNSRKARHHHAIQVEMLYYPQEVKMDMGPTATVPYSQYWTFNHEENQDNFAGADHLDFSYQLSGMERIPISGPKSNYPVDDIVNQTTEHDKRMRKAVQNLDWPLCRPFEVGPLEAGSVVLYSHNLLHRGNHRRDDWKTWADNPRFMWRFWLYRTTEPTVCVDTPPVPWQDAQVDHVTGVDLRELPEKVLSIWNYQSSWMIGRIQAKTSHKNTFNSSKTQEILALTQQLFLPNDNAEPDRIGAAYQLGELSGNSFALEKLKEGLFSERESVRRASMFGLIASGDVSTPVLVQAAQSASKWIRKAGLFALGESGSLDEDSRFQLIHALLNDPSVYVRSVAASSIGCFARRAIGAGKFEHIPSIADAMIQSLSQEENRLSMDREQNRNIKFVRPTDACDVCEGIGFDYGHDRFQPVRSAVRENVLWSSVILCSHGPSVLGNALNRFVDSLCQVVQSDKNLFCVGSAMDALTRLSRLMSDSREPPKASRISDLIPRVFATSPIRCDDSLSRAGVTINRLLESRKSSVDPAAKLPDYDVKR